MMTFKVSGRERIGHNDYKFSGDINTGDRTIAYVQFRSIQFKVNEFDYIGYKDVQPVGSHHDMEEMLRRFVEKEIQKDRIRIVTGLEKW